MENLNEALKKIKLKHDEPSIKAAFDIDDSKIDEFSRTMSLIGDKLENMSVTKIIDHVLKNNELNSLEELICVMFVAGMGTAESKHRANLESMRQEALSLKDKKGEAIKPSDFISAEQIQQLFDESDGKEF